jgi:hypothetical protein
MSHAPPLKYGKLECYGTGFTFSTHRCESPSALALELGLKPHLTPLGRISKRKHDPPKRSRSWWEAQVRLYGLKCSKWTIDRMKEVLRVALQKGLEVPDDLRRMEQNSMKNILHFMQSSKLVPQKRGMTIRPSSHRMLQRQIMILSDSSSNLNRTAGLKFCVDWTIENKSTKPPKEWVSSRRPPMVCEDAAIVFW